MTSGPDDDLRKRPRGVVSHADRKYLILPETFSRQAAHARETEILKRTTESLRDGWLLAHYLPDECVSRIADRLCVGGNWHELRPTPPELIEGSGAIEGVDPGEVRAAPGQMHRGLVGMIALLWRLYGDDKPAFERLVAEGVRGGIESTRTGNWSVDVDIELSRLEEANVDDVIERLEAGEHTSLNDLERQVVISRLAEQDAIDLEALRRSRDRDGAAADAEPNNRKYVKLDDGSFAPVDEFDELDDEE